jgi:magnesium transporter
MLSKCPSTAGSLSEAVWIDLLDPTDDERASVEQAAGLRVPTRAEIDEIEWSSRVFVEGGALYLSTPVLDGIEITRAARTNVGFVLTSRQLVTLRFAGVAAFDKLVSSYPKAGAPSAVDAFLKILETIVDHAADAFERASAELEHISNSAFRGDRLRGARFTDSSDALHAALRQLGRMEDGISHVRDTLLGIDRITAFVLEDGGKQRVGDAAPRLQSIRADVASLKDYQVHLSGKLQFLLDATLGFISIQQNDIVKTLTIASVAGVPPVLIAGIYGMNFRFMPELEWSFGYPFALALLVVSALVPLGWFRWRGWL